MAGNSKYIDGLLHKECTGCAKFLPLDSFTNQAGGLHGKTSKCRGCHATDGKAKRDAAVALLTRNDPGNGIFIGPAQCIRCIHCATHKPFDGFSKNVNLRYGRNNVCKQCVRHYRNTGEIAKRPTDMVADLFKTCRSCEYCLPVSGFSLRPGRERGSPYCLEATCKGCVAAYHVARREKIKLTNSHVAAEIEDQEAGDPQYVNCSSCGEPNRLCDMPIDRSRLSGRKTICVGCSTLVAKKWRRSELPKAVAAREALRKRAHDTKDERNVYEKTRRRRDPVHAMYLRSRKRAKNKGFEFSIEKSDIKWNDTCPVFGVPLVVGAGRGLVGGHAHSPSIDRIDSTKGYIPGNVAIISWRANELKGNATIAELEAILAYMKANLVQEQQDRSQQAA